MPGLAPTVKPVNAGCEGAVARGNISPRRTRAKSGWSVCGFIGKVWGFAVLNGRPGPAMGQVAMICGKSWNCLISHQNGRRVYAKLAMQIIVYLAHHSISKPKVR